EHDPQENEEAAVLHGADYRPAVGPDASVRGSSCRNGVLRAPVEIARRPAPRRSRSLAARSRAPHESSGGLPCAEKAEGPLSRVGLQNPGSVLLSHRVAPAVPSALKSLTCVLGMGARWTS